MSLLRHTRDMFPLVCNSYFKIVFIYFFSKWTQLPGRHMNSAQFWLVLPLMVTWRYSATHRLVEEFERSLAHVIQNKPAETRKAILQRGRPKSLRCASIVQCLFPPFVFFPLRFFPPSFSSPSLTMIQKEHFHSTISLPHEVLSWLCRPTIGLVGYSSGSHKMFFLLFKNHQLWKDRTSKQMPTFFMPEMVPCKLHWCEKLCFPRLCVLNYFFLRIPCFVFNNFFTRVYDMLEENSRIFFYPQARGKCSSAKKKFDFPPLSPKKTFSCCWLF